MQGLNNQQAQYRVPIPFLRDHITETYTDGQPSETFLLDNLHEPDVYRMSLENFSKLMYMFVKRVDGILITDFSICNFIKYLANHNFRLIQKIKIQKNADLP